MAAICPAQGLKEVWSAFFDVLALDFKLSFYDPAVTPDVNTVFTDLTLITSWDEGESQICDFSVQTGPDGGGHMVRTAVSPIVFTNNTGSPIVVSGWVLWINAGITSSIMFVEDLGTPITVPNTQTITWTPTIQDKSEF